MVLVGNDVDFDVQYNYIPSFNVISQAVLKLWTKVHILVKGRRRERRRLGE
jgi:hypothetical protein